MATETQRVQAICDGLLNQSATTGQIDRLGIALASQAGLVNEYQGGTVTQKARIFLDSIRAFCINTVKAREASEAAQAAALSAANSAESSLPESP